MKRLTEFFESRSLTISLLISILIIVFFYHYRWGLTFLNPFYINWIIEDTELANGFFSFGYFRYQDLAFPIGKVESYFYPIGTNLYTTDIPLLALLFKPLSPILPQNFQYLGMWYFVCHVLQAWFTILLCERFGIRGIYRILVVVFLLFAPVMMFRYMHPSLFCQWILLAGLYIYFIDPEKTSVKKILMYQLLLFIVSGLEFAYIWAMIFGFSVALFWRLWLIDKKLSFFQMIKHFGLHMGIMVAIWLLIGLFSLEEMPNYQMEGWGSFTLNLNALYNPMGKGYFLPELPYSYPQYEGYAYLGAGVLLLFLLSFTYFLGRVALKKHTEKISFRKIEGIDLKPLFYFFLFSLIFSLSNTVRFNNTVIIQYPIPDAFANIVNSFRSSGRFFWPMYYFIFIGVFYLFYQSKINTILKNSVVAGCLLIQLYDIQYYLRPVPIKYEAYTPPINPVWENLIKDFDNVAFVPGFRRSYLNVDDYRFFAYYTTLHHKTINVGYPARFDQTAVSREITKQWSKIYNEGLDNGTLYISLEPYLNSLIVPIYEGDAYCFSIDGYLAIFKKTIKTKKLAEALQGIGFDKQLTIASSAMVKPLLAPIDSIVTVKAKSSFYETDFSDKHFFFKGWAFREEGSDFRSDSIYLVLESAVSKKRWISPPCHRFGTSDVVAFFQNPELDQSGFGISLINKNLSNGSYRVGILFQNRSNKTKTLLWMEHVLNVNRPVIPSLSEKKLSNEKSVRYDINFFDEEEKVIRIESWAFPNGEQCPSCKCFFTLRSSAYTYLAEPNTFPRQDVATFFKDSSLVNTGRYIRLNKLPLKPGYYKLGFLFADTLSRLHYFSETDKSIEIRGNNMSKPVIIDAQPEEKSDVRFDINALDDSRELTFIESWAFPTNGMCSACKFYFILSSPERSYAVDATSYERPDVVSSFKDTSLLNTGWSIIMDKSAMIPGAYRLGLLFTDSSRQTSHYSKTDKIINVGGFAFLSELKVIPTGKDSVRAFIDLNEDRGESFQVSGWGFIHELSPSQSRNSLVLRSSHYLFTAEPTIVPRPDLQVYFKLPYSTENAGFKADIRKSDLKPGNYQICVLLRNLKTNEQTLSCLDSYILVE